MSRGLGPTKQTLLWLYIVLSVEAMETWSKNRISKHFLGHIGTMLCGVGLSLFWLLLPWYDGLKFNEVKLELHQTWPNITQFDHNTFLYQLSLQQIDCIQKWLGSKKLKTFNEFKSEISSHDGASMLIIASLFFINYVTVYPFRYLMTTMWSDKDNDSDCMWLAIILFSKPVLPNSVV